MRGSMNKSKKRVSKCSIEEPNPKLEFYKKKPFRAQPNPQPVFSPNLSRPIPLLYGPILGPLDPPPRGHIWGRGAYIVCHTNTYNSKIFFVELEGGAYVGGGGSSNYQHPWQECRGLEESLRGVAAVERARVRSNTWPEERWLVVRCIRGEIADWRFPLNWKTLAEKKLDPKGAICPRAGGGSIMQNRQLCDTVHYRDIAILRYPDRNKYRDMQY